MEHHQTLAGETLEYPTPDPELARYLARLIDAAHDPTVTEGALVGLIYSAENPIMDTTILPGRGMVTRAVHSDPVYRVMSDLLARKREQVGTLAPAQIERAYTVSVSEAARELRITPGAVRQAIEAGRLDALKKGARWFIHPRSVRSFEVAARFRRASPEGGVVRVRVGSKEGYSFQLKAPADLEATTKDGRAIEGVVVPGWRRLAIMAGDKREDSYRVFVLEPGDEDRRVDLDEFFVVGRFVVAAQDSGRQARERWAGFEPS